MVKKKKAQYREVIDNTPCEGCGAGLGAYCIGKGGDTFYSAVHAVRNKAYVKGKCLKSSAVKAAVSPATKSTTVYVNKIEVLYDIEVTVVVDLVMTDIPQSLVDGEENKELSTLIKKQLNTDSITDEELKVTEIKVTDAYAMP